MPHGPELLSPENQVTLRRLSRAATMAVWRDPPRQANPAVLWLSGAIAAAGKTVQGRDTARYVSHGPRNPGLVIVRTILWLVGHAIAWAVLQAIGIPPAREEIDADWQQGGSTTSNRPAGSCDSTYAEYGRHA